MNNAQLNVSFLLFIGDSTVRHGQRRRHKSWAFYQLRSFIEYKAKIAGVLVQLVDPRNTSRTCPQCGFVSKSNRKSQSLFSCQQCGFASNADIVGATNISRRGHCQLAYCLARPCWGWAGTSCLL